MNQEPYKFEGLLSDETSCNLSLKSNCATGYGYSECKADFWFISHKNVGIPLFTPSESKVLKLLESLRPSQPEHIISFTDPGKDPDDTIAAIIGAKLQAMGHMHLDAAITTLGDKYTREIRARLLKGTLEPLGIDVPVAAGVDYAIPPSRMGDETLFFDIGHDLAGPEHVLHKNGYSLLKKQLEAADPNSVTLNVIAGMTDVADLIRRNPVLFKEKVKQVVIMGGIKYKMVPTFEPDGTTVKHDRLGKQVLTIVKDKKGRPLLDLDGNGHIQPDTRAFNNTTDQVAAMEVYKAAQVHGKKLVVLTKEAAYQAPLSHQFYTDLNITRHPLAKFASTIQFIALQRLWMKVRLKVDEALTMPWLLKTFTNVDPEKEPVVFKRMCSDLAGFDEVWQRSTKLNAYDPLTLLATMPHLKAALFKPRSLTHPVDGSVVEIIDGTGIRNPQRIRDVLSVLCKQAFMDTRWSHVVGSSLLKDPVIV